MRWVLKFWKITASGFDQIQNSSDLGMRYNSSSNPEMYSYHLKLGWTLSTEEGVTLLIGKNADKTHYSNYSGTPLSSTTYKIVFNIFLLRLPPYTEEIIGEY